MPWALIIAAIAKYAPEAIGAVIEAFRKTQPTPSDWQKLFEDAAKVAGDFIAKEEAALSATRTTP